MNYNGLKNEEVKSRIRDGLVNKSLSSKTKSLNEILIENIFSVFNLIIFLIIAYLIFFYFKTQDKRLLLDSIGTFSVAFFNTFIAIYQEIKAKKALDKVNLLLKHRINVIRDNQKVLIDQEEIVKDDLIFLQRGDQVVVDGIVVSSNYMEIDESLLTGESNPIEKKINDKVLSGSFCISGNGYYIAQEVGENSYAAKITHLAKKYKINLTPLQRKINFIVKLLFGFAILLVLAEIFIKQDYNGFNVDFIRKISTILLSLVPQGLVLMSSVTFALGVYRISKLGAIVKKLNAIESFSNVQIVCMDKTGTITQNKLSVNKISNISDCYIINEVESLLGIYSHYSSDKNATIKALEKYKSTFKTKLIDEVPFNSERKASLLKLTINDSNKIFILGGYDVLVDKVNIKYKDIVENTFITNKLENFRNLLFGEFDEDINFKELITNFNINNFIPICIISISDTPREDVLDAINLFKKNDINFKILSGDSAEAIWSITNQIGWNIENHQLITGHELEKNKDEFLNIIEDKSIFARLKPEHKLDILKGFRSKNIYTAMIGDGVNDLPAIKEADLGIAMEEGSNITKEVSDIILLKNKFSLLPQIFQEGNKIVNTVNSIAKLFLTKNFLVIFITLMSIFFNLQFPLTPRRVSLINIFAIGLPSFIITLRNSNTEKIKNFTKDIFSFVIISSLIIMTGGYLGSYIGQVYFNSDLQSNQMIMLSIMIITSIANFYSIVFHSQKNQITYYFIYGIVILIFYIFFATIDSNFIIIKVIKEFYEINYIEPKYWIIIVPISIISSFLLFFMQKIKTKIKFPIFI